MKSKNPPIAVIREAGREDLSAIASLLADDGLGKGNERPGDPAYLEAFARMRKQSGNVYLVAERNGVVIACLQYTVIHGLSRTGASRVQLEGIRVHADCRGEGLGEMLVRAAIERARSEGCSLVQLTTDRRRADAFRFYERLGFSASHWGMKLEI